MAINVVVFIVTAVAVVAVVVAVADFVAYTFAVLKNYEYYCYYWKILAKTFPRDRALILKVLV